MIIPRRTLFVAVAVLTVATLLLIPREVITGRPREGLINGLLPASAVQHREVERLQDTARDFHWWGALQKKLAEKAAAVTERVAVLIGGSTATGCRGGMSLTTVGR